MLVERMGHPVKVVSGDPDNLKVTRPGDLERVAAGLIDAFIHKHDLWSGVDCGEEIEPMTAAERQLLRDLYRNLEDVELPFLPMSDRCSLRFAARHGRPSGR